MREDGTVQSEQYPLITVWNVDTFPAGNPDELYESIREISRRRNAIAIHGALRNDADPRATDTGVYRTYKKRAKRKPDFRDFARRWVAVDIDDLVAPKGMQAHSPSKLAEWARGQLPERFRSVGCTYQYTSSYRVDKPAHHLRVRLWFLVDTPIKSLEWRVFWKRQGLPWVDTALYNPVQPIYTAPPTFVDVRAPMRLSERIGYLPGASRVPMGDVSEVLARQAVADARSQVTIEYDPGFEPNMEEVSLAMHRLLSQRTDGARHHHALGAACELVSLGCPGERIVGFVDKLIRDQGREPREGEALGIVEHAVDRFRNGQLKTSHPPVSSVLTPLSEEEDSIVVDVLETDEQELLGYGADIFSNAKIYLRRNCPNGGLLRCNEVDWEWDGMRWKALKSETLLSRVIKDVECSNGRAQSIAGTVRGIVQQEDLDMPGWISDPHTRPTPMAVFRNGMISLADLMMDPEAEISPHDPDFFNTVVLPYDHDPKAECPRWLRFMEDCFSSDMEIRECRKFFGYILAQRNDLQKFFVLQGPSRAGKGVTLEILKNLIGQDNVGFPLLSELANDFAMQPLVGKPLIVVDEANSTLTGRGQERVLDFIKAVTGGTPMQINRKQKEHLQNIKLPGRFVMACNRLPSFLDPSGALLARMVPLIFRQSFVGREDPMLAEKLSTELPGIFNWSVQGMRDLVEDRQKFTIPDQAKEILASARRAAAPTFAFRADCLDLGPKYTCTKESVYNAYCAWCAVHRNRPMAENKLCAELLQMIPSLRSSQIREDGRRKAGWVGCRLNEDGRFYLDPSDIFDPTLT